LPSGCTFANAFPSLGLKTPTDRYCMYLSIPARSMSQFLPNTSLLPGVNSSQAAMPLHTLGGSEPRIASVRLTKPGGGYPLGCYIVKY